MKFLGAYFWYVKMPWRGCVERRLKHITFYIQKYIAHLVACSGPPLVRDGSLGAPAFVKLAYCVEGEWVALPTHLPRNPLAMQPWFHLLGPHWATIAWFGMG